MNIAICDDDQHDMDTLYNYCKCCNLPYNISTFSTASALLKAFESAFYDLVFLDIEMEKPNGFEVGSILSKRYPKAIIIFTTNAPQYAIHGYGIAFLFLCKPITSKMFQDALQKALEQILPQKVILSHGTNKKMISVGDVVFFESLNRHIIFHFTNNTTLDIKDSMENILRLFYHPIFFQIHRSYCINLNYVDSATSSMITMVDGSELPLSRKKQDAFQESFRNLIRGTLQ